MSEIVEGCGSRVQITHLSVGVIEIIIIKIIFRNVNLCVLESLTLDVQLLWNL